MREKRNLDTVPRVRPQMSSAFFYSLSRLLWFALFISFGIDPVVAVLAEEGKTVSTDILIVTLFCSLPVALLTIGQTKLVRSLHSLRRQSGREQRLSPKAVPALILGGLALVSGLKIVGPILLSHSRGFIALPVVVLLGGLFVARFVHYSKLDEQSTRENPMIQVERWNMQTFLIVFVPLIAARSIGLQATLLYGNGDIAPATYAGYFLLSMSLVLCGSPQPDSFIARCRSCWRPTSRAIASVFYHCPACKPDFYRSISR